MELFVDTSFFIAVTDKDDRHYKNARAWKEWFQTHPTRLILHAGILLEIGDGFARIARRETGIHIVSAVLGADNMMCLPLSDELIEKAARLYRDNADKPWGLTDCVSFTLMRKLRMSRALTADHHFSQAGFETLLLRSPVR